MIFQINNQGFANAPKLLRSMHISVYPKNLTLVYPQNIF